MHIADTMISPRTVPQRKPQRFDAARLSPSPLLSAALSAFPDFSAARLRLRFTAHITIAVATEKKISSIINSETNLSGAMSAVETASKSFASVGISSAISVVASLCEIIPINRRVIPEVSVTNGTVRKTAAANAAAAVAMCIAARLPPRARPISPPTTANIQAITVIPIDICSYVMSILTSPEFTESFLRVLLINYTTHLHFCQCA